MRERIRRLMQPISTKPTESFEWSDKRPVRAQITGGILKAVGLVAGFAVLVGAFGGIVVLSDPQRKGTGEIALCWGILAVAASIMFATANRWSPFVAGFFFGPAIFPITSVLVFGSDSYYSAHAFSRRDAAELLFFAVAVVALSARFIGRRPALTTLVDRLALTVFALSTFRQIVVPYRFPPRPLMSGLASLLIAWIAFRLRLSRTARRRRKVATDGPRTG